jgi:hypothetical protein
MGLAIKVTIFELISVIIIMLHISRHLEVRVTRFFIHMIFAPIALLLLAFGIQSVLSFVFVATSYNLIMFLSSGVIYSILFGLLLYFFPRFIGLTAENVKTLESKIRSMLSPKPN